VVPVRARHPRQRRRGPQRSTDEATKKIIDLPDELKSFELNLCSPEKEMEHCRKCCTHFKRSMEVTARQTKLGYDNRREAWPQDLRFRPRPGDADLCRCCGRDRAGHFQPDARCFRPDEPNPREWWHYGVLLPRTCNVLYCLNPCCWPSLFTFYVWGGRALPGGVCLRIQCPCCPLTEPMAGEMGV
jgi:hypothetical protein